MVRVVDIFYGRQFYYCFWIKFNWPTQKKWSKHISKMKWQTPKLSPYICIWIIYFDIFSAAKRNGQIKCFVFLSHLFVLEIRRARYECENINRIKQYRSNKATTQQNSFSIFAAICVLCACVCTTPSRLQSNEIAFVDSSIHRPLKMNWYKLRFNQRWFGNEFQFVQLLKDLYSRFCWMSECMCARADCAIGNLSRLLLCDDKSKQTEKHIHLQ